MKNFVVSSMMILLSVSVYSQSSFEIKKIGSQYTSSQLSSAFESADFCGSYFQSKRNLIVFNDGSEVELKSKNELLNQGITLSENCFLTDDTHYFKSIWSIAENGMIMKGSDTQAYPTEKEYYHFNNINKQ